MSYCWKLSNKNTMVMRNARSFWVVSYCFNVGVSFWCSTDMFVWIVQFYSSCWCCGCVCAAHQYLRTSPRSICRSVHHFWLTVPSILIYFDFLASTSRSLVGMMTESWPIFVSGIAEVKVLVMQHWSSAVRWKSGVPSAVRLWNQVTKRLLVKICRVSMHHCSQSFWRQLQ